MGRQQRLASIAKRTSSKQSLKQAKGTVLFAAGNQHNGKRSLLYICSLPLSTPIPYILDPFPFLLDQRGRLRLLTYSFLHGRVASVMFSLSTELKYDSPPAQRHQPPQEGAIKTLVFWDSGEKAEAHSVALFVQALV